FTWSSVPGAQSYYLYVGTTQGAKDLVDSYGLLTTSYQVPPLPIGQTVWARIWTDVSGVWTYQDISFTTGALSRAYFSYPANGAQNVDPTVPFSWYAVPNAQAYTLFVGTSP